MLVGLDRFHIFPTSSFFWSVLAFQNGKHKSSVNVEIKYLITGYHIPEALKFYNYLPNRHYITSVIK